MRARIAVNGYGEKIVSADVYKLTDIVSLLPPEKEEVKGEDRKACRNPIEDFYHEPKPEPAKEQGKFEKAVRDIMDILNKVNE